MIIGHGYHGILRQAALRMLKYQYKCLENDFCILYDLISEIHPSRRMILWYFFFFYEKCHTFIIQGPKGFSVSPISNTDPSKLLLFGTVLFHADEGDHISGGFLQFWFSQGEKILPISYDEIKCNFMMLLLIPNLWLSAQNMPMCNDLDCTHNTLRGMNTPHRFLVCNKRFM